MNIITKKTSTRWKAWLEDKPNLLPSDALEAVRVWSGKTQAEAVGKLMISATPLTGIAILQEGK